MMEKEVGDDLTLASNFLIDLARLPPCFRNLLLHIYRVKSESHDQVFAQFSCINCVKGRASLLLTIAKPVRNFIAQPCENEN